MPLPTISHAAAFSASREDDYAQRGRHMEDTQSVNLADDDDDDEELYGGRLDWMRFRRSHCVSNPPLSLLHN